MSTRRSFVTTAAAAAVSLASPLRMFAQQNARRQGIPAFSPAALGSYEQGTLTYARFQTLVGSSFRAFLDGNQIVDITLIKVSTLNAIKANEAATLPSAGRSKFKSPVQDPSTLNASAIFIVQFSSGNKYIPQDTYVLDHGILGSFSALLVPGASNNVAKTCSILFNYSAAKPTAVVN